MSRDFDKFVSFPDSTISFLGATVHSTRGCLHATHYDLPWISSQCCMV